MIKFNHVYIYSRGNGKITFTEGKNNTVTANYKVFNDEGTITGKLQASELEATFHSVSMNRVGLIHFTFSENGFDAKWKNGLEPGPMRGSWFTEKINTESTDFVFNINQSSKWDFEDTIEEEVERLFQLQDEKLRDLFVKNATVFINNNPSFYWLSLLIYYKAEECYYESGNDDLCDWYSGFQLLENDFNFNPKEKFKLNFYPEKDKNCDSYWASASDYKWSIGNENKKNFVEIILDILKINIENYEDTALNYSLLRNTATTCLWTSLQSYTMQRPTPESEDLANCLWSVFCDSAHEIEIFKGDGNFGQEAVDNIIKYILRMDKEEFNTEENDDLESFNDYVHDYVKISEEILDRDIFDM
jgi:hypothetical protein